MSKIGTLIARDLAIIALIVLGLWLFDATVSAIGLIVACCLFWMALHVVSASRETRAK